MGIIRAVCCMKRFSSNTKITGLVLIYDYTSHLKISTKLEAAGWGVIVLISL